MAKADLQKQAKKLGLPTSGTVAELEARIALAQDPNTLSRQASPSNPCPRCGRKNPHVH